jgi:hypothetical protein
MSAIPIFILFIFLIGGCSFLSHYDELITLKRLGDSQREIDNYLENQKKEFEFLKDDIKNNRLIAGTAKQDILSTYGEPVLIKQIKDKDKIKEIFLYRHPTQYFSSDRIYLYFDEQERLYSWELQPSQ